MNTISKSLLFVVLGAAVSWVAPLSAQTASASHTRKTTPAPNRVPTGAGERGDGRAVYYITNITATGSHIPTVIERYQGHNTALNSSFRVGSEYTSSDVGITGSLNVGGALRTLDPAISSVSGH